MSSPNPTPSAAVPRRVRIGMAQQLVEFEKPEENMARALGFIGEAARKGCDIVVLPETLDLGWPYQPESDLAQPIPGPRSAALAAAARQHAIYVAAGLTERVGDAFHNAAVLISPEGTILLHHRKINVLIGVEDIYATGDRLGVIDSPFGKLGLDICADSNMPVIPHLLARMGASIILSPCAWAVPPDHEQEREPYGKMWIDAYTSISREYGIGFVGVSNVGPVEAGAWRGWHCIGCSLAVGPEGGVLLQGPYGREAECLLEVEFTPRSPLARGTDWAQAT